MYEVRQMTCKKPGYFFCHPVYRNNHTVLIWYNRNLRSRHDLGEHKRSHSDISLWVWQETKYIFSKHLTVIVLVIFVLKWGEKMHSLQPSPYSHGTNRTQDGKYLKPPMHCPSTGPGRSPLVHPSQSHLFPRTSYQLAAAAETQDNEEMKQVAKEMMRLHRYCWQMGEQAN